MNNCAHEFQYKIVVSEPLTSPHLGHWHETDYYQCSDCEYRCQKVSNGFFDFLNLDELIKNSEKIEWVENIRAKLEIKKVKIINKLKENKDIARENRLSHLKENKDCDRVRFKKMFVDNTTTVTCKICIDNDNVIDQIEKDIKQVHVDFRKKESKEIDKYYKKLNKSAKK